MSGEEAAEVSHEGGAFEMRVAIPSRAISRAAGAGWGDAGHRSVALSFVCGLEIGAAIVSRSGTPLDARGV